MLLIDQKLVTDKPENPNLVEIQILQDQLRRPLKGKMVSPNIFYKYLQIFRHIHKASPKSKFDGGIEISIAIAIF